MLCQCFIDTEGHWEEEKVLEGMVAIFVYRGLSNIMDPHNTPNSDKSQK